MTAVMSNLLKATLILQLSLLFMSSEVHAKPRPRESASDSASTVGTEASDSSSPTKTDPLGTATLNNTVRVEEKCYNDCNTSCNNGQCYGLCILKCNSTSEGRRQRDTSLTAVKCYHNCSTSCDNNQCYEPCVFKCNSNPESPMLPNDETPQARCSNICEATRDKMKSYKHCINSCTGGLRTDDAHPTPNGSDVRHPAVAPHTQSPSLRSTLSVSSTTAMPSTPFTSTFRSLSPIPVNPTLSSISFKSTHSPILTLPAISSASSIPSTPTNSSSSETGNSVAAGGVLHQNQGNQGKNCTTTVLFTCDSNGDNCVAENSTLECEDDISSNGDASKPSSLPCLGLCQKRSVDGRCLKDTSCCESISRDGRQFLDCLIDN